MLPQQNHIVGTDGNDRLIGDRIYFEPLEPGQPPVEIILSTDIIEGLGGDDVIDGGRSPDQIFGGDGDDILTADGASAAWPATGPPFDLGPGFTGDRLEGGAGNDILNGSRNDDYLLGDDGNDKLHGGEGNDKLWDRSGVNVLDGGDGDDVITPGTSGQIDGGAGLDKIEVYGQFDLSGLSISNVESLVGYTAIISGRAAQFDAFDDIRSSGISSDPRQFELTLIATGSPTVLDLSDELGRSGYRRAVSLRGSLDAEILTVGSENDRIWGGGGDDVLHAGFGADELYGDDGNDVLSGGEGRDTLDGGRGNDKLDGGGDNDKLAGGDGDDTLMAGDGGDLLDGGAHGAGGDTADYSTAIGSVVLDLTDTTSLMINGHHVSVTLLGIENLKGSALSDQLFGSALANRLEGGGGDDLLAGGLGDDMLSGGAANDTVGFLAAAGPVVVNLKLTGRQFTGEGADTFSGIESLIGSSFADRFFGDYLDNRFEGGADADLLVGDGGNDLLDGGGGLDRLFGGTGDDRMLGGVGADTLFDSAGIDFFDGGDGADRLFVDGVSADVCFIGSNVAGTDRIFGFVSGATDLQVRAAGFGGTVGAFAFVQGATPAPAGAQQAFLYDTDDGRLYFDADGAGASARVLVCQLFTATRTVPTLAEGDILLV